MQRELIRKHHGEIEKMNKVQFFINSITYNYHFEYRAIFEYGMNK